MGIARWKTVLVKLIILSLMWTITEKIQFTIKNSNKTLTDVLGKTRN